ncbi:MAG: hypothetical protein ABSE95_13280 [Thermodesulfobacteriota bacterium]|jgi:hypothetical protein
MIHSRKAFLFLVSTIVSLVLFSACSTEKAYQVGPVRTFKNPLVEKANTWRGGAIGAALGIPTEGKVMEISDRALREAAQGGKPVAYLSLDGFQRVEACPVGKGTTPNCRLVREQIFQEGKPVRDEIKEVCL